ncbi:MAG: type II toxin-antitoxin system PemK/MazF family toxin, partial [Nanoarchaeota archaeon]
MKLMKGGIVYKQRDIVLIPFPYSDLTGAKQRPALIISNNKINHTQDKICCLITSNSTADGIKI